jgi:hypothetical protein
MTNRITPWCLALALCAAAPAPAEDSVFAKISDHYEAVRLVLIESSTSKVSVNAEAIGRLAGGLEQDFSPEAAGVSDADADAVKTLLPEIEDRATDLAAAQDLAAVRNAFAELTKPLVRYHRLVEGTRPVVAYCPMEKKAWMQPDGPIGNPYDPSMLRCGEVVQR